MPIFIRNLNKRAFLEFSIDAAMNTVAFKASGENTLSQSLVKGVGEAALWSLFLTPKMNLAYGLSQIGVVGTTVAYGAIRRNWSEKKDRFYTPGEIGGRYTDTSQALTMRQAAVHAIRESRINGRLVLGNEASYMHR